MALKYKVVNGDKCLGNFPGKSADIAVDKAIATWSKYGGVDYSKSFEVQRGFDHYSIMREG